MRKLAWKFFTEIELKSSRARIARKIYLHLSQSESRSKSRKEADRKYSKDVDKKDNQNGINESEVENWVSQGSNCKCRHHHQGEVSTIVL